MFAVQVMHLNLSLTQRQNTRALLLSVIREKRGASSAHFYRDSNFFPAEIFVIILI